ncbi:bifunctional DNA primase/polymerase [Streptomyces sp. NPDC059690]|uniref:bifunctional DNA primase/polymerase n=1 Tax=Streptomyces sp. NPDC059690 TaxID=3346907 RepID=UPI0036CA3BE6
MRWHAVGTSVVRATTDGEKRPVGKWTHHQRTRASVEAIRSWFAGGHPGIGIITGAVSGNLEMLEFEGRAVCDGVFQEFTDICNASGLMDVLNRIWGGYTEQTPSGGYHFIYRLTGMDVPGNTKLAQRPATEAELADEPGNKIKPLIETRGEGGFVITAPSHGPVHPTGKPWQLLAGGPDQIAAISAEERDALFQVARMCDQIPRREPARVDGRRTAGDNDGSLRPGDDYEARTEWAEILEPEGWTHVFTRGSTSYWRRPGKHIGMSATTGHAEDRDRLYVFTTSTGFEAERPYTRFGAYALLHHGGDHSAAARELARQGYGEQPRPEPTAQRAVPQTPDGFMDGSPSNGAEQAVTLDDLHVALAEYIHVKDYTPYHVALATAVGAHCDDGDPLWVMIVGPASGGKTEGVALTDLLADQRKDELTSQAALLSWVPGKGKAPGRKAGLLTRVPDPAFVTIKDFSPLLDASNKGTRGELYSAFRALYDGRYDREIGNVPEPLTWEGRITFLTACTNAIDHFTSHSTALGPRWLYCRLGDSEHDKALKLRREGRTAEHRDAARRTAERLVIQARTRLGSVTLSDNAHEQIEAAVRFCALGRGAVPRHGYGKREIDGMPDVEDPYRLAGQLRLLVRSLVALGVPEERAVGVARRCALDSMPRPRLAVLHALAEADTKLTAGAVARGCGGLSRDTALRNLEDLEVIGLTVCDRPDEDEWSPTASWQAKPIRASMPWSLVEGKEGRLAVQVLGAHRKQQGEHVA